MEALSREGVGHRVVQDLFRGQDVPPPGDADVRVGGQVVPPPGDAAVPSAGPSAAVQARLPPVPMDEEDSLSSSVGSLAPEDYAALEALEALSLIHI